MFGDLLLVILYIIIPTSNMYFCFAFNYPSSLKDGVACSCLAALPRATMAAKFCNFLYLIHKCFVSCAPHFYSIIYHTKNQWLYYCFSWTFTGIVLNSINIKYSTEDLAADFIYMRVKSHVDWNISQYFWESYWEL